MSFGIGPRPVKLEASWQTAFMSSVLVCGSAATSVQPDRAVVSLGITYVGTDAASAMDEIAQRSHQLEGVIGAIGLARTDWVTDGVAVAEEWLWKNDTNTLVGYRATSGVSVTVRELALVGTLLRDSVANCGASIRSLTWLVDDTNPARATLLGAAAIDARRRATAYVTALDLRLGDVELISESPIDAVQPQPRMEMMAMRSAKMSDSAPMSVSEGQVELTANVYVRFGILP